MNAALKNVDKVKEEHVEYVHKDIPRYHVVANGSTVEMTNSKPKAEKAFSKSNARNTVLYEINAGIQKAINHKENRAGERSICGGQKLFEIYKDKGYNVWKEAFEKQHQKQQEAA